MQFQNYQTDGFYDEMFEANGAPRAGAAPIFNAINNLPPQDLVRRQRAAEYALLSTGNTFNVYGAEEGAEKILPFDIVPRIIPANEWAIIEAGLIQRIHALNLFIHDVYNEKRIIKDKVVPEELVLGAGSYRRQCEGLSPVRNIWIHVTGTDLIRDEHGVFYVLEDNLRCPSGVSYVVENRNVLKATFPNAFRTMRVRPTVDYPDRLRKALRHLSPKADPRIVVLTPGPYNSAYFEHAFLSQQMGVELAEGRDLVVVDGHLKLRTTGGFETVDVVYRRIDDDFLDPTVFRSDSLLGVPGIMEVYERGNVAIANGVGTGIADDKAVYAYTPRIIRYYLDEEPILPIVPTYVCSDEADRSYVLQHLHELVVKAVNLSGGYGMLIGPASTSTEREEFARKIKDSPRDFVAQPTIKLSRAPVITDGGFAGRHVDLRPYILYGEDIQVLPGGLTRVALREGSLVVNSSQGGGSKDTWVLSSEGQGNA
jgi:uncharacterized circularly permuted ATP-grasp superfamily protein